MEVGDSAAGARLVADHVPSDIHFSDEGRAGPAATPTTRHANGPASPVAGLRCCAHINSRNAVLLVS